MYRLAWRLARGAFPAVFIASLLPLAIFYVMLAAGSVMWAIGVSIVYAYGVALWQFAKRGRVSGMLLVTVVMATFRGGLALLSGHGYVYFALPVLETAGFGLMFLATMFSSEPLVVRLARDVIPAAADGLAARRSLIRSLSLIWTVTYLGSGVTTFVLLSALPLKVFLGAHVFAGWAWSGSGALASVLLVRWRARGLFSSLFGQELFGQERATVPEALAGV